MTEHEAESKNRRSVTDLTGEEREAIAAFEPGAVGELMKAFGRSMETHQKARSESNFRQLIQNIQRMPPPVVPIMDDSLGTSMRAKAEMERVEAQRRVEDSENFKLMAGILVQMDQERRDNMESRRKQTVFNTWMAVIGVLLALGGVVVPIIIEAVKGWK